MVIDWRSSFSIDIIATAPDDNIFVDQRVGRVKGSYTNGEKLPKIEFLGKWQENCVVAHEQAQMVKKWPKIAKNGNDNCKEKTTPSNYHPIFPICLKIQFLAIFHQLCLLMGNPLIPPPLLLKTLLSLGAVAMISKEKAIPGHYHPIFPPFA